MTDHAAAPRPELLFPEGCNCGAYGHGLTMTRVNSPFCPVHGAAGWRDDVLLGYVDGEPVYGPADTFEKERP